MKAEPLIVVAILTVRKGKRAEFEAYEGKAFRVMARVGGAIEREIELEPDGTDVDHFKVIHVIRFESRDAFTRYRSDPELTALAEERADAIAKTEVMLGRDNPLARR